ncbi:hypothetical protein C8Q80DRAFT_1269241 [Daedaleopsis nitida]|nr:hypothetical protein C8Q80DRAFT_1269241 [Daedaleopsis nitida]
MTDVYTAKIGGTHHCTSDAYASAYHGLTHDDLSTGLRDPARRLPDEEAFEAIMWAGGDAMHAGWCQDVAQQHNKKRTYLEKIAAGDVMLTEADLAAIDDILATYPFKGGRYNDSVDPKMLRICG